MGGVHEEVAILLVVERRRIYAESLAGLQGRGAIPSSACRREDLVAPPASSIMGLAGRLVAEVCVVLWCRRRRDNRRAALL